MWPSIAANKIAVNKPQWFWAWLRAWRPVLRLMGLACSLVFLHACSGGSGTQGSERVQDSSVTDNASFIYTGPVPANSEIQHFKTTFYDNVVIRCGSCHTRAGKGPTAFADQKDVNHAWEQAKTLVNLLDPAASELVIRLENGHNCWLNSHASCASAMTGYIERWAAGASQSVSQVNLTPRSPQPLEGLKIAPATYTEVQSTLSFDLTASPELMNLLNTHCDGCHSGSSATPQSPYFASEDPTIAYAALLGKIDLANPDLSRLVIRLQNQHNCWSGPTGCANDAEAMRKAIARFADNLPQVSVDSGLVISGAQILEADGIIASSGGRYENDVIAKWEFREGEGTQVADTSGVQPEIPLTLLGDYEWFGGWGVKLDGGRAQGAVSASSKLYQRLSASGEYTIEAWVAPNNVTQEDAWIWGYAAGPNNRNALLTQTLYNYDFYNRSNTVPASDAAPAASTADDDEIAQATLQHVVLTHDPFNGRKIYVNGQDTGVIDEAGPGALANWSSDYAVVMGNDFASANAWQGVIRMVAVHSRALSQAHIVQNYETGVGQKYFLMFSVSSLLNKNGVCHSVDAGGDDSRTDYCYIVFEVSQFDSSSYLFKNPRFVNINPNNNSNNNTELNFNLNFDLKGIHIGINGQLARTGQGFVNINTNINGSRFTLDDAPLLQRGSIIPLENGPDADVFFLAFKEINGQSDTRTASSSGSFSYEYPADPEADEAAVTVGMRTFDEINESFSSMTRVPKDSGSVSAATGKTVRETFDAVRRSLPSVADFQTFMASHQMAIMQLAAAYCDALVEDTSARAEMFPDLSFSGSIDWESQVVYPLIDRAYATGLDTQPTRPDDGDMDGNTRLGSAHRIELKNELLNMIGKITAGATNEQIVKSTCTAVLASAAATLK